MRWSNLISIQPSNLHPVQFERYVASVLAEIGYVILAYTPASGDFGVDHIVEWKGTKVAVQVKRWEKPAGVKAVQEVVAGASMYHCSQTMVVCMS